MLPFGRPPSPYVGDIIHGRPLLCLLIGIYILKYLKMYHKRQKYITQINYILLTFFYPAKKTFTVIEISGYFFQILARALTDFEQPRTQNEYENSYTFKMFLFQFVNYYSSLIYISFFKGRFFTNPGDRESRNGFVTRLRYDQCDPSGCIYDLSITLFIYLTLRQFYRCSMEILQP